MAAPYSAGSIFLQVIPSFRGMQEAIAAEGRKAAKTMEASGADGGQNFSKGFEKEVSKGIPNAVSKATKDTEKAGGDAGTRAGQQFSGKFGQEVQRATDRLNKSIGDISVGVDLHDAEAQAALRSLQRNVALITDPQHEIGMKISAGTVFAVLGKIEEELHQIQEGSTDINLRVNAAALFEEVQRARLELDRLNMMTVEPEIRVKQTGSFERTIKSAIDNALKDLPPVDLQLNSSSAEREIAQIREELISLSDQTIGVDITDLEAVRKVAELQARLQQLSSEHWGVQVDADTLAAAGRLDVILAMLEKVASERATAVVDADTARADAELQATLAFIRELDGKTARVNVNVDGAAQAVAELEAVDRAAKSASIGGQDGANAFRAFNGYLLAGAALGPAVVPMLAAAGAGAAALGPMAAAGAAGIGALALSFSGVSAAVKGYSAVEKNAANDSLTYNKAVASATDAMVTAQEGLSTARQNAARASEDSARAVASAVIAEQRAREQAAQSAQSAARQVTQADEGVSRAEQTLQRAQETARQAQEALTQAREDAVKAERDLQFQIEGGAIAYQQALLDVTDAEATLAKVRADPNSTPEQIQRATLALQEQQLQVRELAAQNGDNAEKQADWIKGGVEGSTQVVAAQDKIKQANQAVIDGQVALKDAQDAAAQARQQQALDAINSSRNIAQAQQAVAVAREQQDRSAVDSQRAVGDAQRALATAQLNYQDAVTKTSASQRTLNDAMNQLGPAAQGFAKYVYADLLPMFHQLREASADGFLPGFQSWIDTIVGHYGPQLIAITGGMSEAMGHMFQVFGQTLLTKPFQDLFDMLQHDGPTFIGMMGTTLANMGSGVASLVVAMKPLAYLFGDWLIQASGAFKSWAANLGTSSGLQMFFAYVRQVGPEVAAFFSALWHAIANLVVALAPYGEKLMNVFTSMLNWVAGMDPGQLARIAIGLTAIVTAIQGMFAVTAALKSAQSAVNLVGDATDRFGISVGRMLGGVGLLGGGIAVLFQTSSTFRATVSDLLGILDGVLKWAQDAMPWFSGLAGVLANVAGGFMVFKGISNLLGGLGTAITNAAPQIGALREKVTGNADAGERWMGALGKVGGVLSGLGTVLPIAGIAIGIITGIIEAHNQKINDMAKGYLGWFEAMGQGGTAAQEAAGKVASLGEKITTLQRQVDGSTQSWGSAVAAVNPVTGGYSALGQQTEDLSRKHDDLSAALKKAKQDWQDELDKMGPVERAQAELNQAIAEHGSNSEEARGKAELYRAEVDKQRIAQDNAAWAIDGVNNALIRQNDLLLAGAQSEYAYQQSVDALTDAHNRSKEALDKYGQGSDEYRRALLAESVQSLATAQSAAEHEKTLHSNSSTAIQNALSQAALYLELKRQKDQYGELAPAQEQMLQNLERTTSQADIAKVQFDNLGLAVVGVPNDKTIDVASTSPEVEKQLTDLGIHVQHMPDGTVRLTGDTKAAEDLLNFTARDRTSTVFQKVMTMDEANSSFGANMGHNWDAGNAGAPKWAGGFTGPGARMQPAGIVHAGEFVVPKPIVDRMGVQGVARAVGFPGYADGGFVAPLGLPGYAGGGFVANWGGTIDLTGNVAPLARIWADAVRDITGLTGLAAHSVESSFGAMRDGALGATGDLKSNLSSRWGEIGGIVNAGALGVQTGVTGQFQILQANAKGIFSDLNIAIPASWNGMADQLNGRTVDTQVRQVGWFSGLRDSLIGITGTTRDVVSAAWNTMGDNLNWKTGDTSRVVQTSWSTMGANLGQNTRDTVNAVARAFAGVQPAVQDPVNFVVNTVLNQGLFPAFNAVSSAVSLPNVIQNVGYHAVPTNNTPIYAAAGGQVPGWSPHDKADNIPAWLTAGEFVQPVSTVDYYGTDLMDAIRHKKIPKEALASVRFADGGYVGPRQNYAAGGFTWPELDGIRKKLFPGSVLTSAYRPGAADYHGAGEAIDIGVPGNLQSGLMPIAAALARAYPNSTELIHNPNGSIKNGVPVSPGFWGAATWAAHANHVHWAMTPAALGGSPGAGLAASLINPMLAGKWADANAVHDYLANSFAGSNAAVGGGPLGNSLHGIAPRDLQIGWDGAIGNGVRNWFAQAAQAAQAGAAANPGNVPNGPVQDQVRSVFNAYGWGSGPNWDGTAYVVGRESGWNPRAQNPVSTASGLFQHIDGTWRAYRPPAAAGFAHMKDAPVPLQAAAGAKYFQARYGTPAAAAAYWRSHGNYADGGLVVPELHDAGLGGVIHPGLNMILNKTRKAEASVSMDTIDNLRTIAEGGQAPLIGHLTLPLMTQATPEDIAGEIIHQTTVAKRGGKW